MNAPAIPLFRPPLTRPALYDLVEEERRRCASVVDVMCDTRTDLGVLVHYTRVIGRICDFDLRSASFLVTATDAAERSINTVSDSNTLLSLTEFVALRRLELTNRHAQLHDEVNHFGDETLSDAQHQALKTIVESLVNVGHLETALGWMSRSHCSEPAAACDAASEPELRASLQALFFFVLTYSHALREVVCCRTTPHRMLAHAAYGPPALVQFFFRNLATTTKDYVDCRCTEAEYVRRVRLLSRTGSLLSR